MTKTEAVEIMATSTATADFLRNAVERFGSVDAAAEALIAYMAGEER